MNGTKKTDSVVVRKISERDLEAILLDMDIDDEGVPRYMYDSFFNVISENIPEYALGFSGTNPSVAEIREGVKAIFKAKRDEEDNGAFAQRLFSKGFFGEIILHFLLKHLFNTIPLISKIHFKDSRNHEAYGYDAVHVDTDCIYLGEVKFYGLSKSGKSMEKEALDSLLNDISVHFTKEYLESQFTIINKNLSGTNHPEKDKWISEICGLTKLSEKFKKVRVPLLCTYESDMVGEDKVVLESFEETFTTKMRELKKYFDDKNTYKNKDKLDIVLILFPVESKEKIASGIFSKLLAQQGV